MIQIANPSVPALYEDALVYETGTAVTSSGALSAYSGAKTGRSPSDKRIVQEASSEGDVWWGPVNKPMTLDVSHFFFFSFFYARFCWILHCRCWRSWSTPLQMGPMRDPLAIPCICIGRSSFSAELRATLWNAVSTG